MVRTFAIAVALILSTLTLGGSAAASTCAPTGFFRDGFEMTARLVNPSGVVGGTVDATGCNIGVFYGASATGTVDGASISGSNYFGVVAFGDLGDVHVDVRNSTIVGIGEPIPNGTQHGVAVYFRAFGGTATGAVSGNTIRAYQKGGIVTNGPGAAADISSNIVTGLGPVPFIAQNGIQVAFGANSTVRGNSVSGNFFTGPQVYFQNPGGEFPPGWNYDSAGILLFQAGKGAKVSENHFSGNQKNILMSP